MKRGSSDDDEMMADLLPESKRCRSNLHTCSLCQRELEESTITAHGQLVPKGHSLLWRCFRCEEGREVNNIVASRCMADGTTWFLVRWKESSDWHASWVSNDRMASISPIKMRNFEKKNSSPTTPATFEDANQENSDVVDPAWTGADRQHLIDIAAHGIVVPDVHRVIARLNDWRLVKWKQRPYDESTWEHETHVALVAADRLHEFEFREKYGVAAFKEKWKSALEDESNNIECPFLKTQPSWLVGGTLHEYQLLGISWLRSKWHDRTSAILADEMGLGKTVQSIGLIGSIVVDHFHVAEDGGAYGTESAELDEDDLASTFRPIIIVAPLSTLENWERELAMWCPMLNVIALKGNQAARSVLRRRELHARGRGNRQIPKFHCLLTSYELVNSESALLRGFRWSCLIVDEGHRLKSGEGTLHNQLRELDCQHRLLLTGTPLQNSIEELYNLIKFLDKNQFDKLATPDLDAGVAQTPNDEKSLDQLRETLEGRMLRRLKADVLGKALIPAKRELLVHVELTDYQKFLYKAVLTKNYKALCACDEFSSSSPSSSPTTASKDRPKRRRNVLDDGEGRSSSVLSLDNIIMRLRQVCSHTLLMTRKLAHVADFMMAPADGDPLEEMLAGSGKLALLDKMLTKWKSAGNRVLIFSQFKGMLDILQDYLEFKRYRFNRIDGSMKGPSRQKNIDEFSKQGSQSFVFLLSTRAGGLGINLTSADTVVIYDNDWNPHNDLQALSRAHRIGQTKQVAIYRLVSRATVEERMIEVAKRKRCLESAVVSAQRSASSSSASKFTRRQLDDVMRYGVEALFRGQDDKVIEWDDAAVEALLDRKGYGDDNDDSVPEDSPLAELMRSFKVAKISFTTKKTPEYQSRRDEVAGAAGKTPVVEEVDASLAQTDAADGQNGFQWKELLRESYEEHCASPVEMQYIGSRKRRHTAGDGAGTRSVYRRGDNERDGGSMVTQDGKKKNISQIQPGAAAVTDNSIHGSDSHRRLRSDTLHGTANKVIVHGLVGAYGGRWEWLQDLFGVSESVEETRQKCRDLLEKCLADDRFAIGLDPGRVLGRFAFFVLVEKYLSVVESASANSSDSSWTRLHDKRLLAAMCCHGYGCWEEIVTLDQFRLLPALDATLVANGTQQLATPDDRKRERIAFLKNRTRQLEKYLLAEDARERLTTEVAARETSQQLNARLGQWRGRLDELLAEADQIGSIDALNDRLKAAKAIGTEFDAEYAALVAHEARVTTVKRRVIVAEEAANASLRGLTHHASELVRTPAYRWHLGDEAIAPIRGAIRICKEEAATAETHVAELESARAQLDSLIGDCFLQNDNEGDVLQLELEKYTGMWKNRDFRKDDQSIKERTRQLDTFLESERAKLTLSTAQDHAQNNDKMATAKASVSMRSYSIPQLGETCEAADVSTESFQSGLPFSICATKSDDATSLPSITPATMPPTHVCNLPLPSAVAPCPQKQLSVPNLSVPAAAPHSALMEHPSLAIPSTSSLPSVSSTRPHSFSTLPELSYSQAPSTQPIEISPKWVTTPTAAIATQAQSRISSMSATAAEGAAPSPQPTSMPPKIPSTLAPSSSATQPPGSVAQFTPSAASALLLSPAPQDEVQTRKPLEPPPKAAAVLPSQITKMITNAPAVQPSGTKASSSASSETTTMVSTTSIQNVSGEQASKAFSKPQQSALAAQPTEAFEGSSTAAVAAPAPGKPAAQLPDTTSRSSTSSPLVQSLDTTAQSPPGVSSEPPTNISTTASKRAQIAQPSNLYPEESNSTKEAAKSGRSAVQPSGTKASSSASSETTTMVSTTSIQNVSGEQASKAFSKPQQSALAAQPTEAFEGSSNAAVAAPALGKPAAQLPDTTSRSSTSSPLVQSLDTTAQSPPGVSSEPPTNISTTASKRAQIAQPSNLYPEESNSTKEAAKSGRSGPNRPRDLTPNQIRAGTATDSSTPRSKEGTCFTCGHPYDLSSHRCPRNRGEWLPEKAEAARIRYHALRDQKRRQRGARPRSRARNRTRPPSTHDPDSHADEEASSIAFVAPSSSVPAALPEDSSMSSSSVSVVQPVSLATKLSPTASPEPPLNSSTRPPEAAPVAQVPKSVSISPTLSSSAPIPPKALSPPSESCLRSSSASAEQPPEIILRPSPIVLSAQKQSSTTNSSFSSALAPAPSSGEPEVQRPIDSTKLSPSAALAPASSASEPAPVPPRRPANSSPSSAHAPVPSATGPAANAPIGSEKSPPHAAHAPAPSATGPIAKSPITSKKLPPYAADALAPSARESATTSAMSSTKPSPSAAHAPAPSATESAAQPPESSTKPSLSTLAAQPLKAISEALDPTPKQSPIASSVQAPMASGNSSVTESPAPPKRISETSRLNISAAQPSQTHSESPVTAPSVPMKCASTDVPKDVMSTSSQNVSLEPPLKASSKSSAGASSLGAPTRAAPCRRAPHNSPVVALLQASESPPPSASSSKGALSTDTPLPTPRASTKHPTSTLPGPSAHASAKRSKIYTASPRSVSTSKRPANSATGPPAKYLSKIELDTSSSLPTPRASSGHSLGTKSNEHPKGTSSSGDAARRQRSGRDVPSKTFSSSSGHPVSASSRTQLSHSSSIERQSSSATVPKKSRPSSASSSVSRHQSSTVSNRTDSHGVALSPAFSDHIDTSAQNSGGATSGSLRQAQSPPRPSTSRTVTTENLAHAEKKDGQEDIRREDVVKEGGTSSLTKFVPPATPSWRAPAADTERQVPAAGRVQ